ncbi:holin [Acinetobacter phage Acj9]|uniref:Holin n=1 Tax=Acinetobacter phage Acj9 TaxID=760939 RepID=E5EQ29_9CAUD|nr:holin [Acinetobacter phage Acj9]ADG60145.1 T holin lysis mediator [Acinetobacter phage Acj9]
MFGLLDRLFKDNATGKVLASRVMVLIVLFAMGLIWVKGDALAQVYRESSFENYSNILQKEKDKRFDSVIQEQLQIVHVASGADFSAVYVFRPKNLNYFVDLEVYEGKIPESVDPKNMGGFPVDKTSLEYTNHLAGRSFGSEEEFIYLPTTDDNKAVAYMYSCPYFNLDNIYSGTVAMYWETRPRDTKKRLDAVCNQAARAIGRAK